MRQLSERLLQIAKDFIAEARNGRQPAGAQRRMPKTVVSNRVPVTDACKRLVLSD